MITAIKIFKNKVAALPVIVPLTELWNRLVNIGVTADISYFNRKRIRLMNGICSWAFLIYLVYIFLYANQKKLNIVFYESIAGVIAYFIPILLNSRHRYNAACHFFCIFNLFFYMEQSLAGGEAIGIVYQFVPSCATALLFFRSTRVVVLYFLANLLFFLIAKYSFVHYQPFFYYGDQAPSFYYANHIIMFVLLFLIIFYFRSENLRQERLLEKRNSNLSIEKAKAESALTELRAAQAQLIQSEKMASLGELTAGIAHEIQNPLNFVNNFSEVNTEIIDETEQAISAGNTEEARELLVTLRENQVKINQHGKRADAIVKGMLQHSRSNTGHKEPTDINALCDEYLRLAYHGLRAKDKSFNATLKTGFDESIGNINIIPQDIGRVLLNLINNAFYVVAEKKKQHNGDYEPTVSVTTTKKNQQVEIAVSDNGNGIPQKIIDKIFQPFFTTKPTGQGTGLGLSLAYDIIKAHGGEIKVETKQEEGTTFIIRLND